MSRTLYTVIFLTLVSAVAVGAHRYMWIRMVRDAALPGPWRHVVTALLALLCVGLFVGPVAARTLGGRAANLGQAGAFAWLGSLFLFLVAMGSTDLVKVGVDLAQRIFGDGANEAIDPERRLFFQRALSGTATAGAVLATGAAVHGAVRDPEIKRVEVRLPGLPADMDGFRIVQISDLHVSATIRRPYVERVVELTNGLKPDLVALTGDLMDGSVPALREHMAPIASLESTWGSYFCTGNHEYYSGADAWIAELKRLGVRVLRNEHVQVAGIDVAGIDDAHAARFGGDHGPDLPKAVRGRDTSRPLVLLAHQPTAITDAAQHGVNLQLSGHTHGGQIWPFGYLVRLVHPYVSGLHQHTADCQIYVSRGTGYWGPPMRLGAPHELTLVTLRAA